MPLIHKRRIWWEPVPGAIEYVVYVSLDEQPINPASFSWEETPSMISKLVVAKTELTIPDEWPEFPSQSGTYHIAVTSRNEVGNQSDPLIFSGVFNFVSPGAPARGGIESVAAVRPFVQQQAPVRPVQSDTIASINSGLKEIDGGREPDPYAGPKTFPSLANHLRNGDY